MNEEQVRSYWRQLWSEGEVEFAHQFYAPTFLLNADHMTPAEFAAGAAAWLAHFTDFRADVDRIYPIDGGIVSRVVYRAMHTGDFKAVPAAGRTLEVTGLDIFRFADGLVFEHLHEANHELMWEQLGAELCIP